MEDTSGPHLKRERLGSYSHTQTTIPHHMPPGEAPGLHSYHPPPQPAGSMPPSWNPTPSPYHESNEHRHPAPDPPPPHHQHPYPPQVYPPQHTPSGQAPPYPPDPAYSRQGSSSAPTRSPPNPQNPHYPPPVNGAPHDSPYYHPQDYRARPPYAPSESPANGSQPPPLHVATNHEMMPSQSAGQPPPPQYGPPPHSAGPYAPPHWGPPPHESWYAGQRRKPVRAAQACESCRSRKAKCDEGRPQCSHCKDNALTCSYRDVPPQKAEKQVIAITERLESLSEDVKQMTSAWKMQEDKINRLLSMQESQANQLREFTAAAFEDRKPTHAITMTKSRSRNRTKEEQRADGAYYPNPDSSFQQASESTNEAPGYFGGQTDTGTKVTGPMSASNLLLWPAVKEITPPDQSSTYVMDTEITRGLLRLYGAGEGDDKADGHDPAPSPANSSSSGRPNDDEGSNSSPGMHWGTGLPFRPGNGDPLGLQSKAIDENVKSYMDHMHILHPFLDARVLRRMVRLFKEKHSIDYVQHLSRMTQSVGQKRKRDMSDSPNAMVDDHTSPASVPHPDRKRPVAAIEHSISNAIVLLVIALGKICAYRQPLPPPTRTTPQGTPGKNPTPNPALGYSDLPPTFTQSAPTSPHGSSVYPNGIGASIPQNDFMQPKLNLEVIPGLPYFAKAADILGEHAGGSDVSHVQANLLAGLYMGQLARIIPSHWYIANACRACMILINASDYKNRKTSAKRRNLINFAFWSCLQLESDILAEMDIPSSGIIAKEASMLREIPNDLTIIDEDQEKGSNRSDPHNCIRHYSNQIQLRRTLNDAFTNIYDAQRQQHTRPTKLMETIGQNLEGWRSLLKDDWAWSDSAHKSKDINHARMRGKYYGAKYIINRPALHYALSLSWPATPGSRPSESPHGQAGSHSEYTSPAMGHFGASVPNRRFSEMQPPARSDALEPWILEACKRCVDAAILSTTCFDAVEPQRIIITNIFGTSHAQFGNVLVLAATYNSPNPELKSLVDRKVLCTLITRTIEFLLRNKDISPALKEDAHILQYVQKKLNLFLDRDNQARSYPQPGSATSSFTSSHY